MTKFLIVFSILSLTNVIFSTARSLIVINCGKNEASIVCAAYYSFYNIVIIYTVADFSLITKCVITFIANLLGTYIVKYVEEKLHKDRMWVYDATCKENNKRVEELDLALKVLNIKRVYTEVIPNQLYTMQVFSNTKAESKVIKSILENYDIHYHVYETVDA